MKEKKIKLVTKNKKLCVSLTLLKEEKKKKKEEILNSCVPAESADLLEGASAQGKPGHKQKLSSKETGNFSALTFQAPACGEASYRVVGTELSESIWRVCHNHMFMFCTFFSSFCE